MRRPTRAVCSVCVHVCVRRVFEENIRRSRLKILLFFYLRWSNVYSARRSPPVHTHFGLYTRTNCLHGRRAAARLYCYPETYQYIYIRCLLYDVVIIFNLLTRRSLCFSDIYCKQTAADYKPTRWRSRKSPWLNFWNS